MTAPARYNELVLAALTRSDRALTSADVLDAALGLALGAGWTGDDLVLLTRKSVAKRLDHLVRAGAVVQSGSAMDTSTGKMTPAYAAIHPRPTPVPDPPAEPESAPPRLAAQLQARLQAQDELLTEMQQTMQTLRRFNARIRATMRGGATS